MTEERTSPLRERMMVDMRIRGKGEKAQKAHIRAIKGFAAFLGRSPDTATAEDLRAYWREARPQGWLFPGKPKINPLSPRQLNRAFTPAP